MTRRHLLGAVSTGALALAGCVSEPSTPADDGALDAPDDGSGETDRGTEGPVELEHVVLVEQDATLDFDPDETAAGVQELLEASFIEPPTINVYEEIPYASGREYGDHVEAFLGIDSPEPDPDATPREERPDGIVLRTGGRTSADVERTLAHELTHVLQLEEIGDTETMAWLRRDDHQSRRLALAAIEGVAEFVAYEYMDRRRDVGWGEFEDDLDLANYDSLDREMRYVLGPYVHGERYVREVVGQPADTWSLYDALPPTTTHLLDRLDPDESVREPLEVSHDLPDARAQHTGELFVRLALERGREPDRARTAATGWRDDTLLTSPDGMVWVLHYESAAATDALADALKDHVVASDGGDSARATSRIDPVTLEYRLGEPDFVETVEVTVDEGVHVHRPE